MGALRWWSETLGFGYIKKAPADSGRRQISNHPTSNMHVLDLYRHAIELSLLIHVTI